MCHASPAAELLGFLCALTGAVFISYHVYCFDRGQCLKWPGQLGKRHLFRWAMCWIILTSAYGYATWGLIQTYVKYKHGYVAINEGGVEHILPLPYLAWSEHDQRLVRASNYLVSVSWALFVTINAEETLYWHFLLSSVRKRHSIGWTKSWQFKCLVGFMITGLAVMLTMPAIAGNNLVLAEEYIFLAGAIFGTLLTFGSFWLYFAFPGFISDCMARGANGETLARLTLFRNLHSIRTALRVIYIIAISCLAVDGLTEAKVLNKTSFSLDLLYVVGFLSAFSSMILTAMILLPRNMATEAGVKPSSLVFVRPYRLRNQASTLVGSPGQLVLPLPAGSSTATLTDNKAVSHETDTDIGEDPYDILGECLNMSDPPATVRRGRRGEGDVDLEMGLGPRVEEAKEHQPFAAQPGSRMLTGEELQRVQSAQVPLELDDFVSPLFTGQDLDGTNANRTRTLEVVIHTETTVTGS